MNVVEMHPEDLLDKEVLTEAEQARLDAHLERCATCRYDRQLRADFAAEMSGEDTHFDSQEIIALVEGAPLEDEKGKPAAKIEKVEPALEAPLRPAGLPKRRRFRARVWMFAAAALLLVGAAAAGPARGRQMIREFVLGEAPVSEAPPRAAPPATIEIVHTAAPVAPAPIIPVDIAPAQEPVSFTAKPAPMLPAMTSAPVETARTAFDDANDARRRGEYTHAIELYRQLQAKFPSSRESHVSMASMGRLQLDRGDTGSALASFDAYQARGHGDLDESVMVGRATALDRLGRTDEAKRAWQALLNVYPSTPYAEHAKLRIEEAAR